MSEPILKVENVQARYGDFLAVESASLEVPQGKIVSVIGANGAGKSTLMDTIAGVHKPSAGKIIFKGEDITVFGDGDQTRDFIYVKDIVGGLTFVAEHPEVTGVYNVGYGGQITINDLANIIIDAAGSSSKVVHLPERPGDVKHSRSCADKLRNAGWAPKYTLEEGLKTTLEYFKSVTK